MDENVIIARFGKSKFCRTEPQFRYNKGQKLFFADIELPAIYQVHYSNSLNGQAKTVIGDDTGAVVPQEYFIPGEIIYAWIFVNTESYGITKYQVTIPINPKAIVTDQEPDPEHYSIIDEAIDALNDAVENVQNEINSALQEAKDSGEFDGVSGSTIWTYLTTPIAPNFTFYIYLLRGTPDAVPKVNDVIICGGKMYNIVEVHQFDVLASYYADIKGKDGKDGVGVPMGGLPKRLLSKRSNLDYDTEWVYGSLCDIFEGEIDYAFSSGSPVDGHFTPNGFEPNDILLSIANGRIPVIKCNSSNDNEDEGALYFAYSSYSKSISEMFQETTPVRHIRILFYCVKPRGNNTFCTRDMAYLTYVLDDMVILDRLITQDYWLVSSLNYLTRDRDDGSVSLDNSKITNLGEGTNNSDAVNLGQVNEMLDYTWQHMVEKDPEDNSVSMLDARIKDLGEAVTETDAVNLGQVTTLISTNTAFFRGNYLTKGALLMHPWQTTNPEGSYYVTNNDYAIVQSDETHADECWRYVYVTGSGWEAQYRINETPLTLNQLAALNSGITSALVTAFGNKYDKPQSGIPKTDLAANVLPIMLTADVPYNSSLATINADPIAIKTAAESGTPIFCRVRVMTAIESEYKYRYLTFVTGDRTSAQSGYPDMCFTGVDNNSNLCKLEYVTVANQSRWVYSESKIVFSHTIGSLLNLTTTEKGSIVAAINEVNAGTIFLAEYETTPFADIYDANQNGRIVGLVDRNNNTFKGWLLGITSTQALFSCVSETYVDDVTVTSADVWDSELTYFATTEDLDGVADSLDAIAEFIGDPEDLTTTDKSTLIGAINEVNDGLDDKVDKDQGVAHAGDFLVVGSDGIVAPVTMQAWQGGSY